MKRSFVVQALKKARVPVDHLCIPLVPPYSIDSFIPPATQLSRPALIKLHLLSALNPPTTESGWKSLESINELVAIIEGVRSVDTSSIITEKGRLVDGRVRAKTMEIIESSKEKDSSLGQELLELASLKQGSYYIARTPKGIRGKKRGTEKDRM